MALVIYMAFLAVACAYALRDWRGAWLAVVICGVLQDPVRKLTAGGPVAVSFLVVGLFGVILFAARLELASSAREFARRFPSLNAALTVFLFLLMLAAANGLVTYGIDKWKVPLLSFATYVAPLTAILLGYVWLRHEAMMYRFLKFYAWITSIALVGSMLEYFRTDLTILGAVSFEGDYVRHLPGIQIRLLSGVYRSPDIMALHAATLTAIGVAMALRAGMRKEIMIWYGVAGWGFLACILAGRRKAIYFIAVFCVVFMWRYIRRVRVDQIIAVLGIVIVLGAVLRNIATHEETSVYARGATASSDELLGRLEGGTMETFRQFGLMGAGLGTATQGVRHLLGPDDRVGWQEGGLAKLAIEVGLFGILALLALAWIVLRLWLRLTRIPDVRGSSQFLRVTLFGLVAAHGASFLASAQAYSDAVLALLAGFFVGCLFASATLDDRLETGLQAVAPRSPVHTPVGQLAS